MKKILNKINSAELLKEAAELYQAAFSTTNLNLRYKYMQEGDSCKKIAKELIKWETPTRGY